jgi:hypothetical protein
MQDEKRGIDTMTGHDLHKAESAQCVEIDKLPPAGSGYISPEEIQGRFPLLRDLSQEQMTILNKKVLRKIDWRLLPMVSLMYLMK